MATGDFKRDFWVHFMAGGLGGTVGAAVTCPLEVVKTRLQSTMYRSKSFPALQMAVRNPGRGMVGYAVDHVRHVVDLLIAIKQREGLAALWKGLGPNLIGVVPARAIYFSTYNYGKKFYTSLNDHKETSGVHMLSAMTAGISTALATNPIWLVKTRMVGVVIISQLAYTFAKQLQSGDSKIYRNSLHCVQSIVREEGIRGLYKGLSASILGLTETTMQFVLYEYMKKRVLASKQQHSTSPTKPTLDWLETFSLAASAKLFAAITTYPHEVLRTRLRQLPDNAVSGGSRTAYKGLWQTARKIYLEEGAAGLYGGLTAHLMRVVPNAAILFATVEFVLWSADS
ncbi:hypothetical protein HDU97_004860 [Phlyctochytrium planicorne]|nr:hypothetical protein HDU97_004860 [Phlyctochytrium planicorne]